MARNIEIKASIQSVQDLIPRVAAIATMGPFEIIQDDTFFVCAAGRLKLRAVPDGVGELIFYRRADQPGPKESFYHLAPTNAPDSLRDSLSLAYGQSGRVRKHRTLFMIGRTRVHLDRVEGLGHFLELEVVLKDGEGAEAGEQESRALMEKLGILQAHLITGAYIDMLAGKKT